MIPFLISSGLVVRNYIVLQDLAKYWICIGSENVISLCNMQNIEKKKNISKNLKNRNDLVGHCTIWS